MQEKLEELNEESDDEDDEDEDNGFTLSQGEKKNLKKSWSGKHRNFKKLGK